MATHPQRAAVNVMELRVLLDGRAAASVIEARTLGARPGPGGHSPREGRGAAGCRVLSGEVAACSSAVHVWRVVRGGGGQQQVVWEVRALHQPAPPQGVQVCNHCGTPGSAMSTAPATCCCCCCCSTSARTTGRRCSAGAMEVEL